MTVMLSGDGPAAASERRIRDGLEGALAVAGHTHDFQADVVPMLLDGRAQYWQHGAAAIVTELYRFPQRTVLNYWLIGGRLRDALQLVPEIEAWAKTQGCTRAVGFGRKAWTPTVARLGFEPAGIGFRKELSP